MDRIIKKLISVISIFSLLCLIFLVIDMLPIIFKTSYAGIILVILIILIMILEIVALILKNTDINKNYTCNVLIIIASIYFGIVYYVVYNYYIDNSLFSYNIIDYCKQKYLIISILLLIANINLIINNIPKLYLYIRK